MFAILGIVIVFAAIVGGYLMEHGHMLVLLQPAELVIIGGAAVGTLITANPIHTLKGIMGGLMSLLKADKHDRACYLSTLRMLYTLFSNGRKNGDQALEAEVEDPEKSPSISQFPGFLHNKSAVAYLCDTLRVSLMGAAPFDIDALMETDAETQHNEEAEPVQALQSAADALPGLGIVAAVLGVVVTMGALGGPPEEIGHKVAAALVGTFLGILLCYGVVGPLATRISKHHETEQMYLLCLRSSITAFVKGCAPLVAVEFGRRSIPLRVRPAFKELEEACKQGGAAAPVAKAA